MEEEFSEEYLLGEEFDLGERSELDLLRMKEEFVPIKKETDEFETKIENAEVEMFDDKLLLPNDLAKELIHVKEESVTINATNISQICKVERNQEIVEGDIAGEIKRFYCTENETLTTRLAFTGNSCSFEATIDT